MTWSLTRLPSRSRSLKSLTRSKRASTTTTLDPVTETDDPPAPPPPLPAHDPLAFADPLSLPIADHTDVIADTNAVDQEMGPDSADSPTIVSSKVSSRSGHDELPLDVALQHSDNPAQLESVLPSAESSPQPEGVTVEKCKAPTRAPSNASCATNNKDKLLPLTRQPSSAATSVAPSVSLEDLVSTLFSSARAANIRTDDPPPSLSATPNLSTSTLTTTTGPDVHTYLPSTMRHDSSSTQVTHDPASRRRTTLRSASLSRHNGSTHSVVLVSTTTTDASESSGTPTTLAHATGSSPASTLSSALLDHHHPHASPSSMVVRAAIDAVEHRVVARCAVLETENLALRDKVERLEGKAKVHDDSIRDLSARVAALLDRTSDRAEVMSLGRHRGEQVVGGGLREVEGAGRNRTGSVGSLGMRLDAGNPRERMGFATPRTVSGTMMEVKGDQEEQEENDKEREKARKKKNRFRSWF